MLQLVIGSSAISLGILLGTFMGGMCLGSLVLSRFVSDEKHPLGVYAALELGIGLCGLAVLFGMPLVDRVYSSAGGNGGWGIALRAIVASVCLMPPTLLMGASLPAISRWLESKWWGMFYGGNIAGAVFGCLLAGFWLLRLYDMAVATYVAVTVNVTAASISWALARGSIYHREREAQAEGRTAPAIYAVIAISGFCALSAEVVWTRLLSLILGGTVYTFSIILAVFLIGLGLGSSGAAFLLRQSSKPRVVLGVCQALLALAIAWGAWIVSASLPYWPVNPSLSRDPWIHFQLDLVRCLWATLPATVLWGASFPLALAAAGGRDAARLVGRLYAANTAGAIAGAVGSAMVLIPWLGTQNAQRLLIVLSVAAAMMMLWPSRKGWLAVPAGIAIAATLPAIPWRLIADGRQMMTASDGRSLVFAAEGMNASIAVTKLEQVKVFHVSGKVEASSQGHDMRLQRMLGHLPALLHGAPKSVLVVGFGAGVTAGTFTRYPSLEKLVICEIEPLIPRLVGPQFATLNYDVQHDRRTETIYDDGRHYVLTTAETFDIITSDPIHPWVKGNAALYSKEYFEHCKRKLRKGGIVTQWVPLYESDMATVKSEIATFFEVFPNGTIWANDYDGEGYDVVLLGQDSAVELDTERVQRGFTERAVRESLQQAGFRDADELLSTYAGRAAGLKDWLRDAQINTDRTLRLQYLAGMSVNSIQATAIFDEILRYKSPLQNRRH